jgi:hypothetical protein
MEDKIYPLAPVDDILENIGLPKTKVLLDVVSPKTVLGEKLGLKAPGEVLEEVVEDVGNMKFGKMPGLPGFNSR